MEFVSQDFTHLSITKGSVGIIPDNCQLDVRLPYQQARTLLMAARDEMCKVMDQSNRGEPLTNKTYSLFDVQITAKFICECSYQFCKNDLPTLDMNTGELVPPQQMNITIVFFQEP